MKKNNKIFKIRFKESIKGNYLIHNNNHKLQLITRMMINKIQLKVTKINNRIRNN